MSRCSGTIRDYVEMLEKQHASFQLEIDRLQRVINAVPGNMCWKDQGGYNLGVNDATLAGLYNMGSIEALDMNLVIGKHASDLFTAQTAEMLIEHEAPVFDQQLIQTCVDTFVSPTGASYKVLSTKAPMYDISGDPCGIVGTSFTFGSWSQSCEPARND